MIDELADRHDLDPRDPEPWRKSLTGGSDDHGGLYIASPWTETPAAYTVDAFLDHLRHGRTVPRGESASSLALARSFYSIAYRYYRDRLLGDAQARSDLFADLLSHLLQEEGPFHLSAVQRVRFLTRQVIRPRKKTLGAIDQAVADELARLADASGRRAWFTDTVAESNPVGRAARECARVAASEGRALTVIAGTAGSWEIDGPIQSFPPVGELRLPELEPLTLGWPPFLEIVEHCERQRFSEIVVGSLGPMGLAGWAAARLLGTPVAGVYSFDLPAYVRKVTDSPGVEQVVSGYERWLLAWMDRIYVTSSALKEALEDRGLDPKRLHLLPSSPWRSLVREDLWRARSTARAKAPAPLTRPEAAELVEAPPPFPASDLTVVLDPDSAAR